MFFKIICILVLWTKVASELEGLTLVLLVADFDKTKKFEKKLKNEWNPGTWVLN